MKQLESAQLIKMFSEKIPEVQKGFADLMKTIHEASALDEKTRELVLIGILTAIKSASSVKSHSAKALDLGISYDEILSAMALAIPIAGISSVMTCLPYFVELQEERESEGRN